jgi:hypothetical protein
MSEEEVVPAKKKRTAVVRHETFNPEDPASLFTQTSLFEQVQRAATMLSRSSLIPEHLRGEESVSNCFLVIEQAMRWRMSPFAVAQSTYFLSGKMGYEGKLVAAIVNASPRLSRNLSYEYKGQGENRTVQVSGTLKGEDKPRTITGSVGQWQTRKNPKWQELPDQMLSYRGAREWARRHMPEVVLGVYADEEIQEIVHSDRQSVSVSTESLDDFTTPSSVEASDDPVHGSGESGANATKTEEPVEAEIMEKPKKKAEPKPKAEKVAAQPEDDLAKLFDV